MPGGEKIGYLFIDNHYLRLSADPTNSRFVLDAEEAGRRMRVTFKEPFENRPQIERLGSWKYIRMIGETPYLVLSSNESHEIRFEGTGQSERLVAVKQQLVQAHLCPFQTLSIGNYTFCFRSTTYQLISKDKGLTAFAGRHRRIAELFRGSVMEYDGQNLEMIIADNPNFEENESPKLDIVFVFKDWLLKMDSCLFRLGKDYESYTDREIRLSPARNLPLFMYERRRNCFWTKCTTYGKRSLSNWFTS